MRRRDREVTKMDDFIHILDAGQFLHLGLVDEGRPYIVPMNYGYTMEDGRLTFYLHCASEGRKLDIIRKNPECCVQLECDTAPIEGTIACTFGYSYYSLEGFGKACIVEDPAEKIRAMALLMKTQTGRDFEFNERLVSIVTVVRVDCESYTAKHRPVSLKPKLDAEGRIIREE